MIRYLFVTGLTLFKTCGTGTDFLPISGWVTYKYGLILSDKSKPKPTFQASRNVFGNDSDSDDESKKRLALPRPSDLMNRKAKLTQEKVLNEDPTVYQYDEIYEEMVSKKDKEKAKTKEEKKPQYIENLMKAANKRKVENERRIERQVQKEREKEGDEFKDKEVFVTSAYKKKLEEMRLEEEKEKREEYLENIGDVMKQKDLGGFYRHLYEQKLGRDKTEENVEATKPEELEENLKKNDSSTNPDTQKKRNYRKRKSSDRTRLSDGEIEDSDEEINRVNLDDLRLAKKQKSDNIDADSDFSIDESSDEEKDKKNEETLKIKLEKSENINVKDKDSSPKQIKNENTEIKEPVPKEKIDIWKKRTVGIVFEEALKRYYERKAARGC
ncbi:nuclear speckle splicing regulatory protein 1 isoform X1 [Spodoptera litura]|uniref:Nuclear speckle splicing regulatory protein 1 isoform X1 n=1 Tax=Spodoptera litura TaxID=69820 RepID=A0A9J7E469_SPOLT|nr:nuclear speckle splicing regulatory protein 1 isoform X1 [Spodoptera litura]